MGEKREEEVTEEKSAGEKLVEMFQKMYNELEEQEKEGRQE